MSENGVIGRGAEIPWHLPEDFKWFKQKTVGHIVVMGRKTFVSIGRPLPHRETIIVSRSGYRFPGVQTVADIQDIVQRDDRRDPDDGAERGGESNTDLHRDRTIFICGGAQIYAEALPFCSDLFLTHVKRTVVGDILFPEFESRFVREAVLQDNPEFSIVHYRALA